MRVKCILIGAIVFFVLTQIVGFISGAVIHEGMLDSLYEANAGFWRPELNEDPPNIGALMPTWLMNGFILSIVVAWLYCSCRCGEGTSGLSRGARFGLGLGVFAAALCLVWSGIFNLPAKIWTAWGLEAIVTYTLCCAGMGWAVAKWGD